MMHKIKAIKTQDNLIIFATFFDGTVKEYDLKKLCNVYPQLRKLENKQLFDSVQIDVGGYGISWNDDLDLEAETIWNDGVEVAAEAINSIVCLAAKLTEARDRAGLTQKQLSEITGIYQADISKIERGLSNPSVSTLQRLADGMGMVLEINFK